MGIKETSLDFSRVFQLLKANPASQMKHRVQRCGAHVLQEGRGSRVLDLKYGSSASAEKRSGPRVADCRIWIAKVEKHGASESRVLS